MGVDMKLLSALRKSRLTPLLVILLAGAVSIHLVMYTYRDYMDASFGKGEAVIRPDGEENAVPVYYTLSESGSLGEVETIAGAKACAKAVAIEGTVLLKNNGLLPLQEGEIIAPMGFHFLYPVYTGTGAGYVQTREPYLTDFASALQTYYCLNEEFLSAMQKAPLHRISAEDIREVDVSGMNLSNGKPDSAIYEYPADIYDSCKGNCQDQVALVVFGRTGDESRVFQASPYVDGTPHELALSSYETEMVLFAKENCRAVVAVINSSNVMEISILLSGEYECDAVVWIGCPGIAGFGALSDILAGVANPSGRTADIWETDLLSSPSMQNFGTYHYTNTDGITVADNCGGEGMYFLEYAEGIYTGYRYFETASDLNVLPYGELDEKGAVQTAGAVAYPFGYGLSYTRFTQSVESIEEDDSLVHVKVKVSNEGEMDGNETVQLYVTVPYTELDEEWGIEKTTKTLIAFDKIYVKSKESVTVSLSFEKEQMASYCQNHPNEDGTKGCYFLEQGDYVIWLGKNSHDSWDFFSVHVPENIWYDSSHPRMSETRAQTGKSFQLEKEAPLQDVAVQAATNRFEAVTAHMMENEVTDLSRRDFLHTFPEPAKDTIMPEELFSQALFYQPQEGDGSALTEIESSQEVLPARDSSGNRLHVSAMRGVDYEDPLWETFLDQVDFGSEEVSELLLRHSYYTKELEVVAKPASLDMDGPQGLRLRDVSTCVYPSEVVVASTFNTDLAYRYGVSVGNEALFSGITGWYAPGANLHRNAFGGRNFEYYSEDPLLSGKMAGACISGAASQGVVAFLKHFAMVNYEDHSTCLCVWATEQTIRELYLRSFEIAVKEGKATIYCLDGEGNMIFKIMRACTGIMAWLGGEWCAASAPLLTDVLRGEWGFCGTVTTDMALQSTEGIIDKAFLAGSDLRMRSARYTLQDPSSEEMRQAFRRAIKNVCYSYANSNLMQGLSPGTILRYKAAPWEKALWIAECFVLLLCGLLTKMAYDGRL